MAKANISESQYNIPMKFRKMENLHIVFWLFKDLAWCAGIKPLGILMIIPTLTIALIITYRTRDLASELYHNLAVAVWIIANSYWMISEFFAFDSLPINNSSITYKNLALIPFASGILILAYYYLIEKRKEKA